jgi:hypothetical protein
MANIYELRLPTEGDMVKLAKLKPVKLDGFPSSELPENFLDLSADYIIGDEMEDVIENGVPLDFSVESPSEVFIKHLSLSNKQTKNHQNINSF